MTFYSLAEESSWCPQVVNGRRRAAGPCEPALGRGPGLRLCGGSGTSNHAVLPSQDETPWCSWWEGRFVHDRAGIPAAGRPGRPQTLANLTHQPVRRDGCSAVTPNILP